MRSSVLLVIPLLTSCTLITSRGEREFADPDGGRDAGRAETDGGMTDMDAGMLDAGLLTEGEAGCGADTDCAPGLRCGGGICLLVCSNPFDCGESNLGPHCVQVLMDADVPIDFAFCYGYRCDPVDPAACSGGACAIFAETTTGETLVTSCFAYADSPLALGEVCEPSDPVACEPSAFCEDGLETGSGTCRRYCWVADPSTCGGGQSCLPLHGGRRVDGRRLGVCWQACTTPADCPQFLSPVECIDKQCTAMTEGERCSSAGTCPGTACVDRLGTTPICESSADRCVCPCTSSDMCFADFPECEDRGAGFTRCGS